ncbi:J domain-containing protein [Sorangium sp. So ce406]|uniref:J domain-containing protein n=1 Tax=Sorangium sp. So ce406 TaxID=3133311 RepID=UPI003F5C1F24
MPTVANALILEASVAKRKNPYRVLGVRETATGAEITKQYRRLAKECHPDKNGGDAASNERMAGINAAYHELRDPERRAAVDERLRQERVKRNAARAAKKTPRRAEPRPSSTTHPNSIIKVASHPAQAPNTGASLGTVLAGLATAYLGARLINRLSKRYDSTVDRYRGRDGRFRR